ncbi:MAG: winged helix-turn-helix domain-containing protein [Bryobacterales bacterium]
MTQPAQAETVLRFGVFEADLSAGELRRNGHRLRLQEKPFQLLAILLEQRGRVVGKEELQTRLWPDVSVDADGGLNEAVYKLRLALDDSAQAPRYIETVPKRGYRFIAAVDSAGPNYGPPSRRFSWIKMSLYAVGFVLALLLGYSFKPEAEPRRLRSFHLRPDDPVQAPRELRVQQAAISPDGSLIAWVGASGYLWTHDFERDQPRRLDAPNAGSPFWSPDSEYVLFQSKGKLLKARARGGA